MVRDERSIYEYLSLGWVSPPRTLLRGVRKFLPGERVSVCLKSGQLNQLASRDIPKKEEVSHTLDQLLDQVIRSQLVSDVPVGLFLSGGIDSGLLAKHVGIASLDVKSFTVKFENSGNDRKGADESEVAREVARACGLDHHELTVSSDSLLHRIGDTFKSMDQPIVDPACLPLLIMSEFAAEHVKVCLTGDGGDELFMGYGRHRLHGWKRHWQKVPSEIRSGIKSTLSMICSAKKLPTSLSQRVLTAYALIDDASFFPGPFGYWNDDLITDSYVPQWNSVGNSMQAILEAEFSGELSGRMLPKTDHVTMRASLEARVPYLDNRVIAFAQSLPEEKKRQRGRGKVILRESYEQKFGSKLANLPKRGFRVPLTDWLKNELEETVKQRLLSGFYISNEVREKPLIEKLLKEHNTGRREHSIRIWALLALEDWFRRVEV